MIVNLSASFLCARKIYINAINLVSLTFSSLSVISLHGGQPFMFYSLQSYAGRCSRDREAIAVDIYNLGQLPFIV